VQIAIRVLGILFVAQVVGGFALWCYLGARYRRRGVTWWQLLERRAYLQRHELLVPAADPGLRWLWLLGASTALTLVLLISLDGLGMRPSQ
jgi:hypothetical protein